MYEHEDEKIRQLFSEEKSVDERQVPPFHAVLKRPAQPVFRSSARRSLALAGALCALFVLFSVSFLEKDEPVPTGAPSISSFYWESPTQAYLSSPGEGILKYLNPTNQDQASGSQQ